MVASDWLSQFVRATRIRAGLSRQELAGKVSYSLTWVARLERGGLVQPSKETLSAIADALGLSDFERRYLYLLGGHMHPEDIAISEQGIRPYLDGLTQPAAFISSDPSETYYNAEFRRLLKGVEKSANLLHWFYDSPQAREIILDWEEVSHRFVSWMRVNAATAADQARLEMFLSQAMGATEFMSRWQAGIIPVDISTRRTWRLLDLDNDRELKMDMRAWRPFRSHGMMLLGMVAD